MKDYEDLVKEFWDIRRAIYTHRKFLIATCIAGLLLQFAAVALLHDKPGFVFAITLGMMLFAIGVYFLIRNNKHCQEIDKQGDRIFYRDPNWREKANGA